MDSWAEIKKAYNLCDNFPFPPEKVLYAFTTIKRENGSDWFEKMEKSHLAKGRIVNVALRLMEALDVSKKVGAHELTEKLRLHWESKEFNTALSEAEVIAKLLPSSDKIEYHPQIHGISRKPDLLQTIGSLKAQYEIIFPDISADENERNKQMRELSQEVDNILKFGSLDIYLLKLDLDVQSKIIILEKVKELENKVTYTELELSGISFLVFDPNGGITINEGIGKEKNQMEQNIPLALGENDRSQFYRKKLGLKGRSPGLIVYSKLEFSNPFCNFKLLRFFRPALDSRIFQKVILESSQLVSNLPSVVVVIMGRTTALIEDWAEIVVEALKSGQYATPGGVWIRELYWGTDLFTWREILVLNPFATLSIPKKIIATIVGDKMVMKLDK